MSERSRDHQHGDDAAGQEMAHEGAHPMGSFTEGHSDRHHGHEGTLAQGQEAAHDASSHDEGSFGEGLEQG